MKFWEFFFWFAIILLTGCCTTKPKPQIPDLAALMDPRGYCIARCKAVGMRAVQAEVFTDKVLCACVDDPNLEQQ